MKQPSLYQQVNYCSRQPTDYSTQQMTYDQAALTNDIKVDDGWKSYANLATQDSHSAYNSNLTDKSANSKYHSEGRQSLPMQEKSMNIPMQQKQPVIVLDQRNAKNNHDISKKMEVYYRSNPLNAIPENWELESKTSAMQDSMSIRKMGSDRFSPQMLSNSSLKSPVAELKINLSSPNLKIQHQSEIKNLKQETKRDKVEAIKGRLKQLFLNYCDYSLDSGNIFITFTNLLKLLKDCNIYDSQLNQNSVSIIISKECNTTANMIKQITFEQFLNCILRISQLRYKEKFKLHPKSALKAILKNHILPLIKKIEAAVENNSDEYQYSLYTVSELTLKLIIYNEDTQVIFSDILPLIKQIYQNYFEFETSTSKSKSGDCMKDSLKSVMNFVRDFELCPYLIHQKACFLIWYSIANSKDLVELTNNHEINYIISRSQNQGKNFTLGHFIVFIYRMGVIYFNHSQSEPQEYNLIKKLLFFLRKLENSDGFKKFMYKINRTYNDSLTFLPSKDLMSQILKAEGMEMYGANPEDLQCMVTKEAMISRILENYQHQQTKTTENTTTQEEDDEMDQFLINSEDELKKLFEIYCAFGDPMNTKYLKPSKLFKLLKDCGAIKGLSRLQVKSAVQISSVDIDLAFKSVSFKQENTGRQFDPTISCMSSTTAKDNNVSAYMRHQSLMQSKMKSMMSVNQSVQLPSQTSCFDKKTYLIDKGGSNNNRIDFNQFKQVIELLSVKLYPKSTKQQAYKETVEHVLLPQLKHVNNKRCIHNNKISKLLVTLDNQEMINLLTVLHKSIIDVYRVYADSRGFMNFQQFIGFCTDYDLFPVLVTKASLHRVFHSLSFMNDMLSSQLKSLKSHISTRVNSPSRQVVHEMIDEHLFVEALALIALYQEHDSYGNERDDTDDLDEQEPFCKEIGDNEDVNETSPIEKVIYLVEKMANSEGVYKRIKKTIDLSNTIKCNLMDKRDLLSLFKVKYPWYFRNKYYDTVQKKNSFQAIMEMSSIYTEGSQLEL